MNGKPGRKTLLEVQDYFSLPSPALVEKDWHVVQALAAIRDAASDGLTLAFGGGTALGRAFGLLQRMSEDIDLRVIGENAASRPALSLQPGGALPVAPSAIRPEATSYTATGFQPCLTPRALETEEIPQIVEQYRKAARNALAAGFDGVEIHAANGYLIEQFLRDSTNKRTDAYGGSRENRVRLLIEVTEAVAEVCGSERVGIRLSPIAPINGAGLDSDPARTYLHAVERLNAFGLAYIHVIEGATQGPREVPGGFDLQVLRRAFKGLYMANNGYDLKLALEARRHNFADLISFGRLYIANPDLVERLRSGAPLNAPDPATFFGGGSAGYTDYPALASAGYAAA